MSVSNPRHSSDSTNAAVAATRRNLAIVEKPIDKAAPGFDRALDLSRLCCQFRDPDIRRRRGDQIPLPYLGVPCPAQQL
jgi:hypothetical protein